MPGSAIHQKIRIWVQNLALGKKKKNKTKKKTKNNKIAGRHLEIMIWVWPDPLRVLETLTIKGGGGSSLKTILFSEYKFLPTGSLHIQDHFRI